MAQQKRAFETAPDAEGTTNDVESDLDSYRQWRHPNGNFVVVGVGQDLDSKLPSDLPRTPPEWDDASPFDTIDEVAAAVAEAEASHALHEFDTYSLTFSEVYEHEELDVRSDQPYEANGLPIQSDDASYRGTTSETWVTKFTWDVPTEYTGMIRFVHELKAATDTVAHARVLEDGEEIRKWNTDSTTYVENILEVGDIGDTESHSFKFQIRAASTDPQADSPNEIRAQNIRSIPQFTHGGNSFWLSAVERVPLPTDEFKQEVGL